MMGGGGMMSGFGLFGGLIGMIFNLVIVIGFVVLIVWVIKRFTDSPSNLNQPSSQSPREILQMRYAQGEITREQYQQMLNDIS